MVFAQSFCTISLESGVSCICFTMPVGVAGRGAIRIMTFMWA